MKTYEDAIKEEIKELKKVITQLNKLNFCEGYKDYDRCEDCDNNSVIIERAVEYLEQKIQTLQSQLPKANIMCKGKEKKPEHTAGYGRDTESGGVIVTPASTSPADTNFSEVRPQKSKFKRKFKKGRHKKNCVCYKCQIKRNQEQKK